MQTSSVGSTTATTATSSSRTSMDRMSSEDFFALLVSELKNQDPLEPSKTSDMISQVSQIRSIEQSHQLSETLEQLTLQQRTAGASELLGKYVEATRTAYDGTTTEISGIVTGIRFAGNGTAILELDSGETLLATDVSRVTGVEAATDTPAPPATSKATAKATQAHVPQRHGLAGFLNL